MKSKAYKAIKNLLHNELGLSKEEIMAVVLEVIRDETKTAVQRVMNSNPNLFIGDRVKEEVEKSVKRFLNGSTYSSNSRELMQTIGREVAKKIKIQDRDEK